MVAYRIETARTVVRGWEPADAPLLHEAVLASLEHLSEMPWIADEPLALEQRVQLLRRWRSAFDGDRDFVYGIFDADETTVLGGTGLHTRVGENAREIGYWVRASHARQGIATEVSAALTRVALELLGMRWVEIRHDPRNLASEGVPRNLGYSRDAMLRRRSHRSDGTERDTAVWTMFADELGASAAAGFAYTAYDVLGARMDGSPAA